MYPLNPLPGIPTTVSVSPLTAELALGKTLQLTATLSDASGNACAPTQPFIFTSSNPALVTISNNGLCTAAAGDTSVLGTGGQVSISVKYPWAGVPESDAAVHASAVITVTVSPVVFVPVFRTKDSLPGTPFTGSWSRISKAYPES